LDEDKDDCNCRIFFPAEAALMHDKTVGNNLYLDKQRNIDILLTMLAFVVKNLFTVLQDYLK
jgi:hypothetical protein